MSLVRGGLQYGRMANASELTRRRARLLRAQMTPTELRVWKVLRCEFPGWRFRRQEPLGVYIADFCCRPGRIVLEMDGKDHGGVWDERRDAYLRGRGFRVVRVENRDVLEGADWLVEELKVLLEN